MYHPSVLSSVSDQHLFNADPRSESGVSDPYLNGSACISPPGSGTTHNKIEKNENFIHYFVEKY